MSTSLYQNIFVTVGTTSFDELINTVLDKDIIKVNKYLFAITVLFWKFVHIIYRNNSMNISIF